MHENSFCENKKNEEHGERDASATPGLSISATPHHYTKVELYKIAVAVQDLPSDGGTLQKWDLLLLRNGQWLNDKIINAYMGLLARGFRGVYTFVTHFHKFLCEKPMKEIIEWFEVPELIQNRFLVFPIHSSAHWSLIIVRGQRIAWFDSLGYVNDRAVAKIEQFIRAIYKIGGRNYHGLSVQNMNKHVAMQRNGDDCGVFCCAYARFYVDDNLRRIFDSSDIPMIRKNILHELLAGRLIYNYRNP